MWPLVGSNTVLQRRSSLAKTKGVSLCPVLTTEGLKLGKWKFTDLIITRVTLIMHESQAPDPGRTKQIDRETRSVARGIERYWRGIDMGHAKGFKPPQIRVLARVPR